MTDLRLEGVCKSYGDVEVLKDIDLHVTSGEFCVFVGPSGCGKSTLLKVISGLEGVSRGIVFIGGENVNRVSAADRGLAMVFQSYALYPHMRVRKNLSFALENLKTPKDEIHRRVQEAAEMLRIEELLDRKPTALSGGQRQRVAIGRAVVREPRIFLFDEPLSNLDAELRVQMRREITGLHRRLGNTTIYVTHDQVEAMTMADTIVVLRDGRVEQTGAPLELFNRPANLFVAGFIGSPRMNFLEVTAERAAGGGWSVAGSGISVEASGDSWSIENGQSLVLGIRPNHINVCSEREADFELQVESVEHLGAESHIAGRIGSREPLTVHLEGQTPVRAGSRISGRLERDGIHLFDRETGSAVRTHA